MDAMDVSEPDSTSQLLYSYMTSGCSWVLDTFIAPQLQASLQYALGPVCGGCGQRVNCSTLTSETLDQVDLTDETDKLPPQLRQQLYNEVQNWSLPSQVQAQWTRRPIQNSEPTDGRVYSREAHDGPTQVVSNTPVLPTQHIMPPVGYGSEAIGGGRLNSQQPPQIVWSKEARQRGGDKEHAISLQLQSSTGPRKARIAQIKRHDTTAVSNALHSQSSWQGIQQVYDQHDVAGQPILSQQALYFTTLRLTEPAGGSPQLATPRRDAAARSFIGRLAADVSGHAPNLEMRYLASTLWCLGRLGHRDLRSIDRLTAEISRKIQHARPQCCANVLQAVVRLEIGEHVGAGGKQLREAGAAVGDGARAGLVGIVITRFQQVVEEASLQDVALVVWACARLGHADEAVLHSCYARAVEAGADLKPQQAVTLLWAEAKLRTCPHAVQPLVAWVEARHAQLNAQDCANGAWAAATLRVASRTLYDSLLERYEAVRGDAKPREEAMLMYALAIRGIFPPWLFEWKVVSAWVAGLEKRHSTVGELMNRLVALAIYARRARLAYDQRISVVEAARAVQRRVAAVAGANSSDAVKARRVVVKLSGGGLLDASAAPARVLGATAREEGLPGIGRQFREAQKGYSVVQQGSPRRAEPQVMSMGSDVVDPKARRVGWALNGPLSAV